MQRYTFQVPDQDHPYSPSVGPTHSSGPLLPFVPEPLDPTAILGRTIDEWTDHAGSYGMGGPGFLGMDNVPFDAIRYSRKPVVSAINGIAQGGC